LNITVKKIIAFGVGIAFILLSFLPASSFLLFDSFFYVRRFSTILLQILNVIGYIVVVVMGLNLIYSGFLSIREKS